MYYIQVRNRGIEVYSYLGTKYEYLEPSLDSIAYHFLS